MISRRLGYLCWLLAAAALYFFENNTGTRAVLLASILIPAFSVSCAAWTAKKASCRLRVPEKANKGETVSCGCILSGPWAKIGCLLSCGVHWENLLTYETGVWEMEDGEGTFSITCAHCGTLGIKGEKVTTRDWFGLICFPCEASDCVSLLILPDLYPVRVHLSDWFSSSWQEERSGQPRRDGLETENSGVRDYAPGDPVRRIHWKLSAKTDRILIREEDRPTAGSVLLLLETAGYGIDPADMDGTTEALLSVSQALTEEGTVHSVCWRDQEEFQWLEIACGEDFLSMRDALLTTQADETGESIGAFFSRAFPEFRADHVVLFSPRPDTDALSLRETGAVTLALPRHEVGNPDIRVVCVSWEEPELEL